VNNSTLIFYKKGLVATVKLQGSDTTSTIISIGAMAINGVLFKLDAVIGY
jgi:hypothetical protein